VDSQISFDLGTARSDTPACHRQVFLDSAGSSLPPVPVLDAQVAHLRREAEVGGYAAAAERADDLAAGYRTMATLLGCRPEEVALTDSATRSWLAAFDAVPLGPGDRVLVSHVEYAGNAVPLLHRAAAEGFTVEPVPPDADGALSVEALRSMLDERVKLVSLVHVPTNSGLVNPVREVADAAHAVGALVLLDACQSIGQLPVSADELGVDLISGTGRKWLRGPRGTGVLVVRSNVRKRLRPRLVDLHSGAWTGPDQVELRDDARVFELWECSVAARLGLFAAAEYALGIGLAAIEREVGARAGRLRAGLVSVPGVEVLDVGSRRCGIVSFAVGGRSPDVVKALLGERGVTVSISSMPSTRLDMTMRGLDAVVRASPHYFVSEEQVDVAIEAVSGLAGG
jgi:cysteine desulfurase/selenocysteine lyase